MKLTITSIFVFLFSGCFYNSYYFSRSSKVYDDSLREIEIHYDCMGKEYLRVYSIPKSIDSCDEYFIGMNATLKLKIKDTLHFFHFKSKSDTSIYDLSQGNNNLVIREKNDKFGTYYSSECCGCKSWFSHCMANLYFSDTIKLYKFNVSQNDTIWYDISGKLLSHGKLIEINKKGILEEGDFQGKNKPKNFKNR
jgi:hypothetical protein